MLFRSAVVTGGLLLGLCGLGCVQFTDLLNPSFVDLVSSSNQAASLPGDAPGLLVSVQNLTERTAALTVSYRDRTDNVVTYTTTLNSGDTSGQMVECPVKEMTLGNLSDLSESGAVVALVTGTVSDVSAVPYVEVEAFGVLLRTGVNYDCGDAVTFVVRPSTVSRSGYETVAFFRRAQ